MTADPVDALSQVLRLFTILRLLASRRPGRKLGRPELARACGCSVKTIGRDIRVLQSAHILIEYDPTERAYFLPDKSPSSLVTLTPTDIMALALLRGLVASDAAFPFAEEAQITLDKLTGDLSLALRNQMEAACDAWTDLGGMARDYSQAPMRSLMLAAAWRRTIEMRYASRSSGKTEMRLADPYRIDRRDGRYLEMQAWCHNRRKVITFALDRILELRITEDTFEMRDWQPGDAGVVGGLRGGIPTPLIVRFDAEVALFARERRWPFAAEFEDREDGSVIMRGEAQGVEGIVRELLSWRRHAQVLGGPELRARMAEEAQAIATHYSNGEKNE